MSQYFDRVLDKNFPSTGRRDGDRRKIQKYGVVLCITAIYDQAMLQYGPFMVAVLCLYYGIQLYYEELESEVAASEHGELREGQQKMLDMVLGNIECERDVFFQGLD